MNTEFASQIWIRYVTKKLQDTNPCTRDFAIGQNLMQLFEKETGNKANSTILEWDGIAFHCWERLGTKQPYDVVYSNCSNFETVTENHRVYSSCSCSSTNKPTGGMHTWIIAPFSLTPEQAEIYTVFRKEGTRPGDAYQIAQNI